MVELNRKGLRYLPPLYSNTPRIVDIIVSDEVWYDVQFPFPETRDGLWKAAMRATLDQVTSGRRVTMSESPHKKPPGTIISRTDPVNLDVWDIRCTSQDDGTRCFGAFGGLDLFIALTWDYRTSTDRSELDFTAATIDCRKQWDALFPGIPPYKGSTAVDYLSKIFDPYA